MNTSESIFLICKKDKLDYIQNSNNGYICIVLLQVTFISHFLLYFYVYFPISL